MKRVAILLLSGSGVRVLVLGIVLAWGAIVYAEGTPGYAEVLYSTLLFEEQTDGSIKVFGKVANLGDVPLCFVEVHLFFYDDDDRLIGDASTYVLGQTATTKTGIKSLSGIAVAKLAPFILSAPTVLYDTVTSYRILLSWAEADVVTTLGQFSWGVVKIQAGAFSWISSARTKSLERLR